MIALEAPFNPEGGAYVKGESGGAERHGHAHDHGASSEHGHRHDHRTTIITTMRITTMITVTRPAIIQIISTTMGIDIDLEPGRPALPMTAVDWQ